MVKGCGEESAGGCATNFQYGVSIDIEITKNRAPVNLSVCALMLMLRGSQRAAEAKAAAKQPSRHCQALQASTCPNFLSHNHICTLTMPTTPSNLRIPMLVLTLIVLSPTCTCVQVQVAEPTTLFQSRFFGMNVDVPMNAHGTVMGELLWDRSFRSGITGPGSRWAFSATLPSNATLFPSGGADPAYPGYLQIANTGGPTPQLTQTLMGPIYTSETVTLSGMIRCPNPPSSCPTSVSIALTGFTPSFTILGSLTTPLAPLTASWEPFSLPIPVDIGHLTPGIVISFGTGIVQVDELRMAPSSLNGVPRVVPSVVEAMEEMGTSVIRCPGGFNVDSWTWKNSIGPLGSRGEVVFKTTTGVPSFYTPSFGLDECLSLCADTPGMECILQINILEDPSETEDLIEYVFGSSSGSVWGSQRAANGRAEPYPLTLIELGNEPNKIYARPEDGEADAGRGYAVRALSHLMVLKSQAPQTVRVLGAGETTFVLADWLQPPSSDPVLLLLQRWNGWVFSNGTTPPLSQELDYVSAHYYSFWGSGSSETETTVSQMSTARMLQASTDVVQERYVDKPFFYTEYGTVIAVGSVIQTPPLMDLRAGLVAADGIFAAVENESIEGACYFNLAERVGFGTLVVRDVSDPATFVKRPTGLALSLLARLQGGMVCPANLTGSPITTSSTNSGAVPMGLAYADVSAIVTTNGLALINRNTGSDASVTVTLPDGFVDGSVVVQTLGAGIALTANNEVTDEVVIVGSSAAVVGREITLTVPAHSLIVANLTYVPPPTCPVPSDANGVTDPSCSFKVGGSCSVVCNNGYSGGGSSSCVVPGPVFDPPFSPCLPVSPPPPPPSPPPPPPSTGASAIGGGSGEEDSGGVAGLSTTTFALAVVAPLVAVGVAVAVVGVWVVRKRSASRRVDGSSATELGRVGKK